VIFLRFLPYVWRTIRRAPVRTLLTLVGTALALGLFAFVRTLEDGVDRIERSAAQPVLVVFQESRFCPLTSALPSRYRTEIDRIEGVSASMPTTIFVNQCQSNLDLVALHGVDPESLATVGGVRVIEGSDQVWKGNRNGALVGRRLAERRKLKVGDRAQLAGMNLTVDGIVEGSGPGLDNVAFVHETSLQIQRKMLGKTTEFLVRLAPGADAAEVARQIDARFSTDEAPTAKPRTPRPPPSRSDAPPRARPEPEPQSERSGVGGVEDMAWAGIAAAAEAATLGVRLATKAFEAVRKDADRK